MQFSSLSPSSRSLPTPSPLWALLGPLMVPSHGTLLFSDNNLKVFDLHSPAIFVFEESSLEN